MMNQTIKNIVGEYQAKFQITEGSIVINVTHPLKQQVYFGRITDQYMPEHLKQIADNTKELYEYICDLDGEKIHINANNQLALLVDVGKKVKTYTISLEKVQISSEEALKKKVQDLEKQLQRKNFQAQFFKEQYLFLLQHLQLSPNVQELEKIYRRNVSEIFSEKSQKMSKVQSMYEKQESLDTSASSISMRSQRVSKVGSSQKIQKEILKCTKLHALANEVAAHAYFKCNICRQMIVVGDLRYHCRPCDFDVCKNCIKIPPQNRKYCPKEHAMTFGSAGNYLVRSCDLCKKSVAFTKAFTCLQCNYDACQACLK